jgi:hypothetical protein
MWTKGDREMSTKGERDEQPQFERRASKVRLLLRGIGLASDAVRVFALRTGNARAEGESGSRSAASPAKLSFALSGGVQGGIGYFTENTPFGTDSNIGQGLAPGYNLGLRASFEFFSWLAFDARGLLLNNNGDRLVNFGSTTTSGGLGAARFTLPVPHIHPYALAALVGITWERRPADRRPRRRCFSTRPRGRLSPGSALSCRRRMASRSASNGCIPTFTTRCSLRFRAPTAGTRARSASSCSTGYRSRRRQSCIQ